jgi:hypothetical protein
MAATHMSTPIRVKFLSRVRLPDGNVGDDYLRRFPNREPLWGNCQFIFDPDCREYDWLVVYDDLPRDSPVEALACPRDHTLLITGEPSSITYYGKSFLKQFGHVLTSQETWALKHPDVIRRQAGLLWYYGGSDERGTYDSHAATPPPQKSKLLSTVCSTKAMRHTLHSLRLHFTKQLMAELPELDVFGYGMGKLDNKADAIDPYRYHLVIENHSCPHHWTEKLADAYLGYALPIYFGCTNLDEYFPPESFIMLDIRDFPKSLKTLRDLLASNEYEKRLPSIIDARRRVLTEYSTFPQLAALLAGRSSPRTTTRAGMVVRSRRESRRRAPLGLPLELFAKFKQKARLSGHR